MFKMCATHTDSLRWVGNTFVVGKIGSLHGNLSCCLQSLQTPVVTKSIMDQMWRSPSPIILLITSFTFLMTALNLLTFRLPLLPQTQMNMKQAIQLDSAHHPPLPLSRSPMTTPEKKPCSHWIGGPNTKIPHSGTSQTVRHREGLLGGPVDGPNWVASKQYLGGTLTMAIGSTKTDFQIQFGSAPRRCSRPRGCVLNTAELPIHALVAGRDQPHTRLKGIKLEHMLL